ncbi:MAG: hypothetical protein JWL88_459 [Parcubacteria group bacterium]|nr:hypothetical protein [Parcubacteria group bacterium]
MKKTVIIIGVILLIACLASGGYLLFRAFSSNPNLQVATSTNPFADVQGGTGVASTNTIPTKTIKLYNGDSLVVKDFTKDSTVIKDPYVAGQYDIAGGADVNASTPYQIFYNTQDDYFGITLFKEPLGQNRMSAEQKLLNTLGVSQDALCKISYVVAPGPGINDLYAGKNLGFSFCPGAVKLP